MDGSSNEKWLLLLSGDGDGDRGISKEFYDQDRQDLKKKKKKSPLDDIPFHRVLDPRSCR